jgi:hypothetical protein
MPAPQKPIGHRVTFDADQVAKVACFHDAKTPLAVPMAKLVAALQKFVDVHFAPVWGTPCRLVAASGPVAGAWGLAFLDDADAADVLGYHDLTADGLPLSKVFLNTLAHPKTDTSVTASHEIAEMLVDPAVNLYSSGANPKTMYAYEMADPVEEETFQVDGLPMSDFVYPAYFESFRKPGSARFDHLGKLSAPFTLRPGGYQIVLQGNSWTQLHGSSRKARDFAKEDRRQHRSELRKVGATRRSSARLGKAIGGGSR